MKYETETNETKKPTVVVEKSALEEFLEEWGSWRGKKKAVKAERDSYIVQPRNNKRKKAKRLEDSWWYMSLKICGLLIEGIAEMIMVIFSFFFSFKIIAVIAAIVYFVDFDIKTEIMKEVGEQGIEHTDAAKDAIGKSISNSESIQQRIEDKLKAVQDKLDGIRLTIEKDDGTTQTYEGSDLFSTEPVSEDTGIKQ